MIREVLFELTHSLSVYLEHSPLTIASLTLSLIVQICSVSSQLSAAIRADAMRELLNASRTLTEFSTDSLAVQDVQAVLGVLSNIFDSFFNNTAVDPAERAELAAEFEPLLTSLSLGLAQGMVPFQQSSQVQIEGFLVQSRVFTQASHVCIQAEVSSASKQITFSPEPEPMPSACVLRDGSSTSNTVAASLFMTRDNIYGGDISSSLFGLSLFDSISHEPHLVNQGEVLLYIPFIEDSEDIEPVGICQFWVEDGSSDWSSYEFGYWGTAGCTVLNSSSTGVWCNCSHLTTFSAPGLPPVSTAQWTVLTWENILNYPTAFITLLCLTWFFFVLSFFAYRTDQRLDRLGLLEAFAEFQDIEEQLINMTTTVGVTEPILHLRERKLGQPKSTSCCSAGMSLRVTTWLKKKHSWGSIFSRPLYSSISSLHRTAMLYTSLLFALSLLAIMVKGESTSKDFLVIFYCALLNTVSRQTVDVYVFFAFTIFILRIYWLVAFSCSV